MKVNIALHLITLPPTAISSELMGVGTLPVNPLGFFTSGVSGALSRT